MEATTHSAALAGFEVMSIRAWPTPTTSSEEALGFVWLCPVTILSIAPGVLVGVALTRAARLGDDRD